jgi:hypothetical protein
VSPVKYEMGLYIPEGDILHSRCSENFKSNMKYRVQTWRYATLAPGIVVPLKSLALRFLLITADTKAVAYTGN